jgi:hypothetical protein
MKRLKWLLFQIRNPLFRRFRRNIAFSQLAEIVAGGERYVLLLLLSELAKSRRAAYSRDLLLLIQVFPSDLLETSPEAHRFFRLAGKNGLTVHATVDIYKEALMLCVR